VSLPGAAANWAAICARANTPVGRANALTGFQF